jgi:iron complex outermembrane receptor protein
MTIRFARLAYGASLTCLLFPFGPSQASAQQGATLPELTIEGARQQAAAPRQARRPASRQAARRVGVAAAPDRAPAATPALDAAQQGATVQATTAGPVRGYEALTSVSATRTDLPIQNTPQSVVVLPRKVLDDQGATTISEALTNVSGVQPLNPITYGQLNPKVRGFAAERVVDGLPNYFDAGGRDLTINVERIEALKGPQGVLFSGGTNATGGVINVVSKMPTANRFVEVGTIAGGYRSFSPFFDINQPLNTDGTALFRMTGQYEDARSHIDVLERRSFTINPTLTLTNHAGTSLTIQANYSRRSQQDYSGLPTVGTIDRSAFSLRRNLFPANPNVPDATSDIASATATLDHAINATWSSSTIVRVATSNFSEPSQGLVSNLPSAGSVFDAYNLKIEEKTKEISFNSIIKGVFTSEAARHTLLMGVDYNRVADRGRMLGDFVGAPADFVTGQFPAFISPTGLYIDGDNKYAVMGATAQVQSSFYNRFHVVAGARLARIDVTDNDLTGGRALVTGSSIAETQTTKMLPRVGVAFDVTRNVALFTGYSENMRPVPYLLSIDPMRPEQSKQIEAGVKVSTSFGLSATIAAFEVRRTNVPVASGFLSVQSGEQRARGVEMDTVYQPDANWSFLASYAYTETKVLNDTTPTFVGATLPGVPRNAGRLWANYLVTDGGMKGLSVGAGVYGASGQTIELGQAWRTQAYATVDAKIAYERDGWKVGLFGKNLTDAKYFTRYEYFSGRVVPGPGRTVYATLSRKF